MTNLACAQYALLNAAWTNSRMPFFTVTFDFIMESATSGSKQFGL